MSGLAVEGLVARRGGFALGPVDLAVGPGAAVALIGPSGAGKTTLLRAVAGFVPLDAGRIVRNGESVEREPPERRRLGFVPPNLGLFPDRTVRSNVMFPLWLAGRADARRRAAEWVERFGLSGLADRYPAQLSSGQRQRVAMARALAAEPTALLWDEPLGALDVDARDTLLALLRGVLETQRIPLVLVTHDPETAAAVASTYVVLDAGRVRRSAAPEALAAGPLDRFTARFLGFDNLYSRAELEAARDRPVGAALLAAAGAGGVAVPPGAVRWERRTGAGGSVAGLRATPGGWTAALRDGPLTFRVRVDGPVPTLRVGDPVAIDLERSVLRPLEGGGEPA